MRDTTRGRLIICGFRHRSVQPALFLLHAPGGVKSTPHEQVLRLEEIETISGPPPLWVLKIRLTGEPLVRKGWKAWCGAFQKYRY